MKKSLESKLTLTHKSFSDYVHACLTFSDFMIIISF